MFLLYCLVSVAVLSNASAQNSDNTRRVYGGTYLGYGLHKYLVALKDKNNDLICSGNIIDPYWILTAAHCVDSLTEDIYITHATNGTKRKIAKVGFPSHVYIHPSYEIVKSSEYDLALLKTNRPVNGAFPDYVAPILLSEDNVDPTAVIEQQVVFAGYGASEHGAPKKPRAGIAYITKCPDRIKSTLLCIHSYTNGAGPGDSGGSAVIDGKLVGVIVDGNCYEENYLQSCYTFFAKVSSSYNWIRDTVELG